MVILEAGDGYQVIANNGFVWIEFADGSECVFGDEEADEAWAEFERREAESLTTRSQ
jgi:hypothetical protein